MKLERILVVDDQAANIVLLRSLLDDEGYVNVVSTTDPREVGPILEGLGPDLILLDLHMPHRDGIDLVEEIRNHLSADEYLPVVILSSDDSPDARRRALAAGATDFLRKPVNEEELLLRIRSWLETRFVYLALQDHNELLESRVLERTSQLEQAKSELLERLALAAEYRDDVTGRHIHRVSRSSALVASALGWEEADVDLMARAAALHDVGKIGIPDKILLKPTKLTAGEFELMKRHTTIGGRIMSGSSAPSLRLAEEIALSHHERWDGRGYNGLSREAIPLSGRIVAIADVYDALVHDRPYKKAWGRERALEEVSRQRGHQFDPDVVDAFLHVQAHPATIEPDTIRLPA
ncbi:MAG: response regulator [Actinobacteria bacterium]|nr:response regulator [Actinomycetota bacterium]